MALDGLRNLGGRAKNKLGLVRERLAQVEALEARVRELEAQIGQFETRLAPQETELALLRWMVTSNTAHMVPSFEETQIIGGGNFLQIGHEMLRLLIVCARLSSRESVLDVGCGNGRVALPLTQYLSESARYEGFDIIPSLVDWCSTRITPYYPNFRFQCVDLTNTFYNPKGGLESSKFRFPYDDASFDVVFLTSVFTHMLPADIQQYTSEIARVLKPEGRMMATVFLLNEHALNTIAQGETWMLPGTDDLGGYRVRLPEYPEEAVFYDEPVFMGFLRDSGLDRDLQTWYGAWSRGQGLTYQDLIVTGKR